MVLEAASAHATGAAESAVKKGSTFRVDISTQKVKILTVSPAGPP